jgi:rhomboid family GlyGly-CTERM serine protease
MTKARSTATLRGLLQDNWYVLLVAGIAVLIAVAGPHAGHALRYDRAAILHGQWWRVLTGNFVHLGWSHLWLNLAGWLLVWLLFKDHVPIRTWIIATVFCSLGVGLGLLWGSPDLEWYVGLSGLLHGYFVVGALLSIRMGYRFELLLVASVIAKLAWEQTVGPLPGSEKYSGGHVVVDAHLYGALAGLVLALLPMRWIAGESVKPSASQSR